MQLSLAPVCRGTEGEAQGWELGIPPTFLYWFQGVSLGWGTGCMSCPSPPTGLGLGCKSL